MEEPKTLPWYYKIFNQDIKLDNIMPDEQREFITKVADYMLETTNMNKEEAYDFAFRVEQCNKGLAKILKEYQKPETQTHVGKWEVLSTDANGVMIQCPECGRLVCTESPDSYYYCP